MNYKKEQVVLLCGGQGTRLREETEFKPKALVEIGGRPILWHLMQIYYRAGYRRFVLCLGYKGQMIKEYFLNYKWLEFDFTLSLRSGDKMAHGGGRDLEDWEIIFAETGEDAQTGCRLARAAKYVDSDTFMFNYCDGLSDIDLDALTAFHRQNGRIATVTGFHPRSRYGIVRADAHDVVNYWQEKPLLQDLTSGGYFVLQKKIFDYVQDDPNCIFEKAPLEKLAADSALALYVHGGFWYSMDTYKEALALNEMVKGAQAPWVRS